MSIRAVDWALKNVGGLKKGEKLVLVALANYSDENNVCWPAQRELAKKTGLRRETVNRSLKSLEKKGLLESKLSSLSENTKNGGTEKHYEIFVGKDICKNA